MIPYASLLVGQGMRRIRERRAVILDDVASAARAMGIPWDISTVSRVETGKREVTLDEFLALPLIMTLAIGEPVGQADMMSPDELRCVEVAHSKQAERARESLDESAEVREIQRLADSLDVEYEDVAGAITALWGATATVTGERERRLAAANGDLTRLASVRTRRGHITRQLTAELRAALADRVPL